MYLHKRTIVSSVIGLLAGALIILGIRYFAYKPEQIHYHANFSVFINGQQEKFNSPAYYEEDSSSCALGSDVQPAERAHMHDDAYNVVHVHDHAVTWGDFFMNLHWAVGSSFITTPDRIYLADATNHITYIINGHAMDDISTVVIHDQDRLLVDYGDTAGAAIQKEFSNVASTAHQYDVGKDPAACRGNAAVTWKDRIKHLF